jgi:hypothetical protein
MMCREECQAQNKGDQLGTCLEVWPLLLVSPLEKELGCESARLLDAAFAQFREASTHIVCIATRPFIGSKSSKTAHLR